MTALGPGAFASIRDGRSLHYVSRGSGSPTVVFESGMGASRSSWALVFSAVAEHCRAVVYDRSGLGRSPVDPSPRTLSRAADDLVDLLESLGDGPFVLVGHSYGGPIVRVAAALAPGVVGGLVLVDQTDEACDLYFSPSAMRQQRMMVALLPLAARTGLLRRLIRRTAHALPADVLTEMLTEDTTPTATQTLRAELDPLMDDLHHLRTTPTPATPDVPVTIISGTMPVRFGAKNRAALIAAHQRRAAALPQGRHVPAERSGHLVMLTQPDLVAAEVLRLVESIRRG